jgi:hypothetical protein
MNILQLLKKYLLLKIIYINSITTIKTFSKNESNNRNLGNQQ